MTERIIQRVLSRHFANYDYILFNTFLFNWESDFFALSKSKYSVEVEIKCSRGDFRNDFKSKTDKHLLFDNHNKAAIVQKKWPFKPYMRNNEIYNPDTYHYRPGDSSLVSFCVPAEHLPNKFYYACPAGMLKPEEIPHYAGLFYIEEYKNVAGTDYHIKEIKRAPFLHKLVKDHTKDLLQKYYWKHINDRKDIFIQLHQLKNLVAFNDDQKQLIDNVIQKFT